MASAKLRMLLTQAVRLAFSLAFARAGNNKAARMAMIAITTSNSIKVNPRRAFDFIKREVVFTIPNPLPHWVQVISGAWRLAQAWLTPANGGLPRHSWRQNSGVPIVPSTGDWPE